MARPAKGLKQEQMDELSNLDAALQAVHALSHAAMEVPMRGPLIVYGMGTKVPEPRDEAKTAPTLPIALRMAREVVTAAEGLREQVARVEAMVEAVPEVSGSA
jgi:hypothetical protein